MPARLSTTQAMRHMRRLITDLTEIVFDEDDDDFALDRRSFKRDGDEFSFFVEYETDWLAPLNYPETESANQALSLFWLVAQSLPGWSADMASSGEVRWYKD